MIAWLTRKARTDLVAKDDEPRRWWMAPVKSTAEYRKAKAWFDAYEMPTAQGEAAEQEADEKVNAALEYAKSMYEAQCKALITLDDKADSLLRLAGTAGFALFAAVKGLNAESSGYLVAALVSLVASIGFALWTRRPQEKETPPGIDAMLDELKGYSLEQTKVDVAAAHHLAMVSLKIVGDRKARWIDWAARMIFVSMVCLLLHFALVPAREPAKEPIRVEVVEPASVSSSVPALPAAP